MKKVIIEDKVFHLYLTEKNIQELVKNLADKLITDFKDKRPLFLPILNGSFMFASDLFKCFDFPSEISFMKVSSYNGTQSEGCINELIGIDPSSVKNRTIVIIEDIIETGKSILFVIQKLKEYQAAEIKICTLFIKPECFQNNLFPIDYAGKSISNDFIVGYGMDYNGFGRNLKEIYQLND